MARPPMAAMVSSTNPASFSSVPCGSPPARRTGRPRARQQSMAAGVVPQSSCSFRPLAPAAICSSRGAGSLGVALAQQAPVDRQRLGGLQHPRDVPRAGCRWWRWCRRPAQVPPPIIVVMPLDSAWYTCCARSCGCARRPPPGVAIRCSPAMTSVPGPTTRSGMHAVHHVGIADLPTATINPWRTPMSALMTPSIGSMMMALVMDQVQRTVAVGRLRGLAHAVPGRLCPRRTPTRRRGVSRSRSTWQTRDVSARRNRSPTVGP